MNKTPLVSICCVTYNHANYIKEAIEGFLMQKTSFPFEVIIHDDASTDGTIAIIKSYAVEHPELILPIFQSENQYSKKQGPILPRFVYPHARGKYISVCEGDDYWIDPNKLQKQVDFLEWNREYSMCFHKAKVISEIDELNDPLYNDLEDRDYCSDELLKTWTIPTASIVCRREFINLIPKSNKFVASDIILILTMAEHGKVRCINELMSVYRRTQTGAVLSQKRNPSYFIHRAEHYKEISHCFRKVSRTTIDQLIIKQYAGICLFFLKHINIRQFVSNYCKFLREYNFDFVFGFNSSLFHSIRIRFRNLNKTRQSD
jgi:glycosyltransferase involved in cell wall biosynthesis